MDTTVETADRSIGAILVDDGRLTLKNAERIIRLQKTENLRFGEAGIKLGLLSDGDIQFALAKQYDYPYLVGRNGEVSETLIAAYNPFSKRVEALRAMRSQLMLRKFTGESRTKALAVVSPARGEGRSFVAANLAIVFSQLGERTLLIDADMRNPSQHELFRLDGRNGLSSILAGRSDRTAVERVPGFVDLSVLAAGPIPPNPQELLGRPVFADLLKELDSEYDVILIDTPSVADFADAHLVSARAGAAVAIARKHFTRIEQVRRHTEIMNRAGVKVVGTVLNEF